LNFGGIGGSLVSKLVKPTKIFCSRTPHESGVDQFLLSKTKAHIGAAAAGILAKTDATVWQKVRGLDSADRAFHQATELLALLIGDGCAQVLDLDQSLADEHDLGDFRVARKNEAARAADAAAWMRSAVLVPRVR
jgi:hypothetical protein